MQPKRLNNHNRIYINWLQLSGVIVVQVIQQNTIPFHIWWKGSASEAWPKLGRKFHVKKTYLSMNILWRRLMVSVCFSSLRIYFIILSRFPHLFHRNKRTQFWKNIEILKTIMKAELTGNNSSSTVHEVLGTRRHQLNKQHKINRHQLNK